MQSHKSSRDFISGHVLSQNLAQRPCLEGNVPSVLGRGSRGSDSEGWRVCSPEVPDSVSSTPQIGLYPTAQMYPA